MSCFLQWTLEQFTWFRNETLKSSCYRSAHNSYVIPKPNQNKNPTNSNASTQACPFLTLVTSREEPPLYPEFPLPGDTLTSRHSDYTKFFSLPYVILIIQLDFKRTNNLIWIHISLLLSHKKDRLIEYHWKKSNYGFIKNTDC